MMQYSLRSHIPKRITFSEDRLSKIFYLMVVNNGEPLKVTYAISFILQRQNLEVLFSIFMSDGTFLKVRYTKNIPLSGGF